MNTPLLKPLILLAIVLVAPICMLAIWGEAFGDELRRWQTDPPGQGVVAALVAAILAVDVVLPVPSGPVSTWAGSQLGAFWGMVVSSCGMTVGAAIAFGLARRWGTPLAERLAGAEQLAEAQQACDRHGPWILVLTRPLPVLAEASALLVGGLLLSWRRFLPPVVASNVAIAAVYSILGQHAAQHGWLPLALCASAAAPLAIAVWWRRRLGSAAGNDETAADSH